MTERMNLAQYREYVGASSISASGRMVPVAAVKESLTTQRLMLRIELPFPPASLFPNKSNGKHWATKHADKVKARDDAVIVARIAAKRVGFVAVDTTYPVVVTFEVNRDNKDLDGMLSASKPLIDGVATGIGVNDKRFRPMTLVVRKTSAAQQVIVEIADAKLGTFYPDRAPYDPNCPLGEIYA